MASTPAVIDDMALAYRAQLNRSHTAMTFSTSSPQWLMTFTAILPVVGRGKGRLRWAGCRARPRRGRQSPGTAAAARSSSRRAGEGATLWAGAIAAPRVAVPAGWRYNYNLLCAGRWASTPNGARPSRGRGRLLVESGPSPAPWRSASPTQGRADQGTLGGDLFALGGARSARPGHRHVPLRRD